jgi:hypothetical protein
VGDAYNLPIEPCKDLCVSRGAEISRSALGGKPILQATVEAAIYLPISGADVRKGLESKSDNLNFRPAAALARPARG